MDKKFMMDFFQSRFFEGNLGETSPEESAARSLYREKLRNLLQSLPQYTEDQISELEEIQMDLEFEISQRMYLLGAEDRERMLR